MPRPFGTEPLTVRVTTGLLAELTAEAWECEMTVSEYVAGLLKRRGKWARTVGTAGGYDVRAPLPPKKGTRAAREARRE